jgi:hypothetical protein
MVVDESIVVFLCICKAKVYSVETRERERIGSAVSELAGNELFVTITLNAFSCILFLFFYGCNVYTRDVFAVFRLIALKRDVVYMCPSY